MRHQQLTEELQGEGPFFMPRVHWMKTNVGNTSGTWTKTTAPSAAGKFENPKAAGAVAGDNAADANTVRVREAQVDGARRSCVSCGSQALLPLNVQSPAFAWGGWLAAAAAAVLAVVFFNTNAGLREEVESLNRRVVELESEMTTQRNTCGNDESSRQPL
jgi:hypothetical protein